jgi:hypothetical protein
MDSRSKKLLVAFCALVLISLAFTYYRSFVSNDFEVIPFEPRDGEREPLTE